MMEAAGTTTEERREESYERREFATVSTMTFVKRTLKLQSLLFQFIHPNVRADYLKGAFEVRPYSEDILSAMDKVRSICIPPWRGFPLSGVERCVSDSYFHIEKMLEECDLVFDLAGESPIVWSYKNWSFYFSSLESAQYWSRVNMDHVRVTALVVPNIPENPEMYVSEDSSPAGRPKYKESVKNSSGHAGCKPKVKSEFTGRREQYGRNSCVESITLSDTSEDAESSSSDDSSSEGESYIARSRRRQNKFSQKEIVKPRPFEMNGWQPFKQFLSSYERYFYSKFDGNSRDCTQELSDFLPLEMKMYYDALGGCRLKYSQMKRELKIWHKKHRKGGSKYWRDQLQKAECKPGESLRFYGMRLKELGQKAFPNSLQDCLKEIRYQFLKTVPKKFAKRIIHAEELRCVDGGRKFKWAEIMKLAEKEDDHAREDEVSDSGYRNRQVYYTRNVPELPNPPSPQHEPTKASRTFHSTGFPKRNQTSNMKDRTPCSWCGWNNHDYDNCWLRLGACLICGNYNHRKENCPRFKRPNVKEVVCPLCQGGHLGKDCTNKNLN